MSLVSGETHAAPDTTAWMLMARAYWARSTRHLHILRKELRLSQLSHWGCNPFATEITILVCIIEIRGQVEGDALDACGRNALKTCSQDMLPTVTRSLL